MGSPLMLLIAFTYFVFATFVFTYGLAMSWVPEFETGAKMWPLVFSRVKVMLMFSNVTMLGYMALDSAYIEAAALIPLLFIVWFFTNGITNRFRPVFRSPSISSATEKDTQINQVINRGDDYGIDQFGDRKRLDTAYLPSIMTVEYPSYEERMSIANGHDEDRSVAGGNADQNGQNDAEYDSYQNDS